jgi:hypothetical protein
MIETDEIAQPIEADVTREVSAPQVRVQRSAVALIRARR